MKAANVLATIGNTPHIRVNRLFGATHEVWIKSERANPGGLSVERCYLLRCPVQSGRSSSAPFRVPLRGGTSGGLARSTARIVPRAAPLGDNHALLQPPA